MRTTFTLATDFDVFASTRRRNRLDHQRNVEGAYDSPAANSSTVLPLAFHAAIRVDHVASVLVIHARMRRRDGYEKDAASCTAYYFLASTNGARPPADDPAKLKGLLAGVASGQLPAALTFGTEGDKTRFICGFLGCDPRPFDPLLEALPRMLHVARGAVHLKELVDLALANRDGVGAASVRERLSESMFIETVRQHVEHLAPARAGWLAGLHDPIVGRALALIHADLAASWTLASLAKKCGASRSVLADRFAKLVGQPPMQYLARSRMQTAAQLLRRRGATVAEIAREIGYESEAAFSRAFKKAHGVAPSEILS